MMQEACKKVSCGRLKAKERVPALGQDSLTVGTKDPGASVGRQDVEPGRNRVGLEPPCEREHRRARSRNYLQLVFWGYEWRCYQGVESTRVSPL